MDPDEQEAARRISAAKLIPDQLVDTNNISKNVAGSAVSAVRGKGTTIQNLSKQQQWQRPHDSESVAQPIYWALSPQKQVIFELKPSISPSQSDAIDHTAVMPQHEQCTLSLTNCSSVQQRMRFILEDSSGAFEFHYTSKGMIVPGVTQKVIIHSRAASFGELHAFLHVESTLENFSIPIIAYPKPTCLDRIPNAILLRSTIGNIAEETFTIHNTLPIEFALTCAVENDSATVINAILSSFTLKPFQSVTLQISFKPRQQATVSAAIKVSCMSVCSERSNLIRSVRVTAIGESIQNEPEKAHDTHDSKTAITAHRQRSIPQLRISSAPRSRSPVSSTKYTQNHAQLESCTSVKAIRARCQELSQLERSLPMNPTKIRLGDDMMDSKTRMQLLQRRAAENELEAAKFREQQRKQHALSFADRPVVFVVGEASEAVPKFDIKPVDMWDSQQRVIGRFLGLVGKIQLQIRLNNRMEALNQKVPTYKSNIASSDVNTLAKLFQTSLSDIYKTHPIQLRHPLQPLEQPLSLFVPSLFSSLSSPAEPTIPVIQPQKDPPVQPSTAPIAEPQIRSKEVISTTVKPLLAAISGMPSVTQLTNATTSSSLRSLSRKKEPLFDPNSSLHSAATFSPIQELPIPCAIPISKALFFTSTTKIGRTMPSSPYLSQTQPWFLSDPIACMRIADFSGPMLSDFYKPRYVRTLPVDFNSMELATSWQGPPISDEQLIQPLQPPSEEEVQQYLSDVPMPNLGPITNTIAENSNNGAGSMKVSNKNFRKNEILSSRITQSVITPSSANTASESRFTFSTFANNGELMRAIERLHESRSNEIRNALKGQASRINKAV